MQMIYDPSLGAKAPLVDLDDEIAGLRWAIDDALTLLRAAESSLVDADLESTIKAMREAGRGLLQLACYADGTLPEGEE